MSDSASPDASQSQLDAQCLLDEFDYELPPERIAQEPAKRRDQARLLVMDRQSPGASEPADSYRHHRVGDLAELLRPGDLVVMNATRVLPARLVGRKPTGGAVEALVLGEDVPGSGRFRALVRSSGRLRVGQKFLFSNQALSGSPESSDRSGPGTTLEAELLERGERGEFTLQFDPGESPYAIGSAPLPPYIRRLDAASDYPFDDERYQTVFARVPGAVAAPTAGLHMTRKLLGALDAAGIRRAEVVLHVGAGTFRPVSDEDLARGRLHAEAYQVPSETAEAIGETRSRGGRVVAIGTTTTRVLETCAETVDGQVVVSAGSGETDLFLRPGVPLRVVDALLTNFHQPRSSLLLLVAAFAGRDSILAAYRKAIELEYRFYSYGDAMLIL